MQKKKKQVKKEYEIAGYYYDGKKAETILMKKDGSGKTKRIKGIV